MKKYTSQYIRWSVAQSKYGNMSGEIITILSQGIDTNKQLHANKIILNSWTKNSLFRLLHMSCIFDGVGDWIFNSVKFEIKMSFRSWLVGVRSIFYFVSTHSMVVIWSYIGYMMYIINNIYDARNERRSHSKLRRKTERRIREKKELVFIMRRWTFRL